MYFNGAFGLCIGIKIQGMVKDYFHCCRLVVCKIFFIVCSKRNSVSCRVFSSQGKRKESMSVTSLTFMSTACLQKGEQTPNIYGLMLKNFLSSEMWHNRHKREPYSLQAITVSLYSKENTAKFEAL